MVDKALKTWAQSPLNGRRIRNVFHSARLFARPPMTGQLTESNIGDALQDVVKFDKMIEEENQDVERSHTAHWTS